MNRLLVKKDIVNWLTTYLLFFDRKNIHLKPLYINLLIQSHDELSQSMYLKSPDLNIQSYYNLYKIASIHPMFVEREKKLWCAWLEEFVKKNVEKFSEFHPKKDSEHFVLKTKRNSNISSGYSSVKSITELLNQNENLNFWVNSSQDNVFTWDKEKLPVHSSKSAPIKSNNVSCQFEFSNLTILTKFL